MSKVTKQTSRSEALLSRAVQFYAASRDANGIPVRRLVEEGWSIAEVRSTLVPLVAENILEAVFVETDENPHIQRLPRFFRKPFEELIESCDLEGACIYPSPDTILAKVDLARWAQKPYTLQVWRGASQLEVIFFDLAVLERYRNDPRYRYSQDFFGGSIGIKSDHYEKMPERDQSFIDRFGIGYDANRHWVIGVLLYKLRHLSPEHQRIWREYERSDKCTLNEASLRTWYLGEWISFNSIFAALPEELRLINAMAVAAFGKPLFKSDFMDKHPANYGVLLRPTEREFLDFARALDLMLADNLDVKFFPGWVKRQETVTKKDGTQIEKAKGTISLLKEWILRSFTALDGKDAAKEVTDPMQKVRSLRSKASHKDVVDSFDVEIENRQRQLILDVYEGVRTLRMILANHPAAQAVDVPEWLFEGDIRQL